MKSKALHWFALLSFASFALVGCSAKGTIGSTPQQPGVDSARHEATANSIVAEYAPSSHHCEKPKVKCKVANPIIVRRSARAKASATRQKSSLVDGAAPADVRGCWLNGGDPNFDYSCSDGCYIDNGDFQTGNLVCSTSPTFGPGGGGGGSDPNAGSFGGSFDGSDGAPPTASPADGACDPAIANPGLTPGTCIARIPPALGQNCNGSQLALGSNWPVSTSDKAHQVVDIASITEQDSLGFSQIVGYAYAMGNGTMYLQETPNDPSFLNAIAASVPGLGELAKNLQASHVGDMVPTTSSYGKALLRKIKGSPTADYGSCFTKPLYA